MLYSILIYVPEDLVDAMSREEEESHPVIGLAGFLDNL